MKVTLIPGRELDAEILRVWVKLQQSNPDLASPFFHPEFTRIVAEVRDDVEVAVIEDGGRITALFPFQRARNTVAGPVGGVISDYQAMICAPDFECAPRELLRQCRLAAWDFDHLLASQKQFSQFHFRFNPSPQIDLSKGFDLYVRNRSEAGTELFNRIKYAARRVERELGPLRFVPHSADPCLLQNTLAWKSHQYRETGKPDLLQVNWIRQALERMQVAQLDAFQGMLSLLYAGDKLLAGHFGIRSHTHWHYWFPAYDPKFAKYSPGLILLLRIAEHAPSHGIRVVDLGSGMAEYKKRFMNSSTLVAAGSVEMPLMNLKRRVARSLGNAAKSLVITAGLGEPIRRWVRSRRNRLAKK